MAHQINNPCAGRMQLSADGQTAEHAYCALSVGDMFTSIWDEGGCDEGRLYTVTGFSDIGNDIKVHIDGGYGFLSEISQDAVVARAEYRGADYGEE